MPKGPPLPSGPAPLLSRLLRRPWPLVDVHVVKTSDCCLCDEALEVLTRWRHPLGLRIRITDITGHPELLQSYGEEVPVVFIADKKRFWGRVDPILLRRAVEGAR